MAKRTKRPDTGIAILPNGVKIPEATRDLLAKHNWAEGPRRVRDPRVFDPNSATTADLVQHRFSGWRLNQITHFMELWVLGHKVNEKPSIDCTPQVMATMHEEAFATTGSLFSFDLAKDDVQRTTMEKLVKGALKKAKEGR